MGVSRLFVFFAVLTVAAVLPIQPSITGLSSPQGLYPSVAPWQNLMWDLTSGPVSANPTFASLGVQPTSPDTVFQPDNRTRITDMTSFPWRTMAKLLIYTNSYDSPSFECSGFLVSPVHVLTAGHCVNDREFSTSDHQASRIEVIPASSFQGEPFGRSWAKVMRVLPNWLRSWDFRDDLALLTLNSTIGDKTGWLDLRADFLWSPIYLGTLYTAGYPGDKYPPGENLYSAVGQGCSASEDNLWYNMDTYQGQSGSPVFALIRQKPYVVSIVTYGSTGCNVGTRMSEGKVNAILDWMRTDNGGTPPIRYVDLTTPGLAVANFTPASVTSGVTRLTIALQVVNQGTNASGPFTVSYYASSDRTIDPRDFLLGTQGVEGLAPSASTDVRWSGIVPSNLAGGRYWIGWIIEAGGNVTEIDVENNAAFVDTSQMTASSNPLPVQPASVAAAALLIGVPITILALVLQVSRRRPVTHPAWAPQQFPPPPPPPEAPFQPGWRYCAHCGTPFVPDMRFCANCGAWLR